MFLTIVAVTVWAVVLVLAAITERSITITSGGEEKVAIHNPLLRVAVVAIAILALAALLVVCGFLMGVVGKFLLLPFVNLF